MASNHSGVPPFEVRINGNVFFSPEQFITGREILKLAGLEPAEHYEILMKLTGQEFEPVELDEKKNLGHTGIETFEARLVHQLTIFLDDEPFKVFDCFMTPVEILALDKKKPEHYYLKQILGHREITYKEDELHKIAMKDNMRFSSCKKGPTPVS